MKKHAQGIAERFERILAEEDPDKRQALSRRLRAEIGGEMDDNSRARLAELGIDIVRLLRVLREID